MGREEVDDVWDGHQGRMVRDVGDFDRMGWESQNDENPRGKALIILIECIP